MTSEDPIWYIPEYLVDIPHIVLFAPSQIRTFRAAERIEQQAGDILEWSDGRRSC